MRKYTQPELYGDKAVLFLTRPVIGLSALTGMSYPQLAHMIGKLKTLMMRPYPFQILAREFMRAFGLGSFESRAMAGAVERPHYAYCLYQAAKLAKKLGHGRISAIEFGVAGGNGLVVLEQHAREISKIFSIEIEVYGFDTGEGLPEPADYRDLPYHWQAGFFKMDIPALQARLTSAKLVLGDIKETAKTFFAEYDPAPVGFVIHDFDFYSSTAMGLKLFEGDEKYFLPRVYCYFDDVIGTENELYNEFTGELLAIDEFNRGHENIKLARSRHFLNQLILGVWINQIWICHFFTHSKYSQFVGEENQQLKLSE
jgi:hypothetical protein